MAKNNSANAAGSTGERKTRTYYEILGIQEDSNDKAVREAYVKQSKICHPDANPADKNLHDKFVLVQQAYETLSKADSREQYDLSLQYYRRSRFSLRGQEKRTIITPSTESYYHKPWRDESIWEMRDKKQDRPIDENSYYGIKGIRRVPNKIIASLCCGLLAIGALIHYTAYKRTMTFSTQQLHDSSRLLSESYHATREAAALNGRERQAELLLERMTEFQHEQYGAVSKPKWDDLSLDE